MLVTRNDAADHDYGGDDHDADDGHEAVQRQVQEAVLLDGLLPLVLPIGWCCT